MTRWIVGRREDLLWFQGSVLAGVALLAVFRALPPLAPAGNPAAHPAFLVLLLWGVLFDGTHVWGTYARSYLVADPASREGLPGRASWALLAVGPAAALAGHALPGPPLPIFDAFLLGAYLWAYWHLVRQHYGFLVLYRIRSGETGRAGARLDTGLLWLGCLHPFLVFSLGDAYAATGLPVLVPDAFRPVARVALDAAAIGAALVLVAIAVSGRLEPLRPGPKHLFLAIVVAFHQFTFAALDDLLEIAAVLTLFHNLQYHRIVWHHERGRGRTPSGGLVRYVGLGAVLGLVWYVPRTTAIAILEPSLARDVLIGLGWGVAFHHYLVDGRIWRVRRSTSVRRALEHGAPP